MKTQKVITLIAIFLTFNTFSQDLSCKDFKIGTFYIPQNEDLREYTISFRDSIKKFTPEKDLSINKYIVVRSDKTQIEWVNGIDIGKPEHEVINWIDECTYRLTYDSTKSKLDDDKKWINDNNGLIVTSIKIEGQCMLYNATITTIKGQTISQKGVICKK